MKEKKDKRKQSKASKSAEGKLKAVTHGRHSEVINNLLKNNGIDARMLQPKMENYESLLKWGDDSKAYIITMAKVRKEYIELAHTLGGKSVEIQDEIARLSIFLDKMERDMITTGDNPISSKEYMAALKLKKEYIIEKNKLNIEYGKATTDYAIKKQNNPDAFQEDTLW